MSPSESAVTVTINVKVRRKWAVRLAGWLLALVRVDMFVNGKRTGRAPGRVGLTWKDDEENEEVA